MRLKDTVFKQLGPDLWMLHTASPYKVRVNVETLARLESLLAKRPGEGLAPEEEFLYGKLQAKGMVLAEPGGPGQLRLKRRSLLDNIELEFSGSCDLSCRHCFAAMSGRMMGPEVFAKVVAGAVELDAVTLILSGGEPLLNPGFPQACRQARAAELKVIVMTNGAPVTKELAQGMRQAGVAEAVVSLDCFQEQHERLRGPGSFAAAARGIRLLVEERVPVYVTALVTDGGVGRLDEFKAFCLKELAVSGVRLSAVVPMGRAARGQGLGLSDADFANVFQADCAQEAGEPAKGFKCSAGSRQLFVAADGQVYPCRYFQNLGESIGALNDDPLSAVYRRNLEGGLTGSFDRGSLRQCRACPKYAACLGGCRARAKLLEGDISAPDPFSCRVYGVPARALNSRTAS
ncbi:MAG: radical SAM protein [Elusimicrobia bacterium]|nr:radical SAM protein [Elusimicrobiota bacterium]